MTRTEWILGVLLLAAILVGPPAWTRWYHPAPRPGAEARSLTWAHAADGTTYDPMTGLPEMVVHTKTGVQLILIPAGEYIRGWRSDLGPGPAPETPGHVTTMTQPFYLGATEVTQGEWTQIMPDNPSAHNKGRAWPVENVSYPAIETFLRQSGFRLPTEAEWEYACKGGQELPAETVDEREALAWVLQNRPAANWVSATLLEKAWIRGNSTNSTQPVRLKARNGFGLYDMIGNVEEWTASWYDPAEYQRFGDGAVDPRGLGTGDLKAIRGQHFQQRRHHCRCSARSPSRATPRERSRTRGFRVAHNVE